MDLIMTRVLGVRGELASLRGLKLTRALMILFEVPGRVLTRIDMQFNVASTSRASLQFRVQLVTRAFAVKIDPLTCSPVELPTFYPVVRTLQPLSSEDQVTGDLGVLYPARHLEYRHTVSTC